MRPTWWMLAAALSLWGPSALAQRSRRPTPHQAIDRALRPLREAIDALQPTPEERESLRDVVDRGERCAAELTSAEYRRDADTARARARCVEFLARVARARVEASRAEAAADEAERRLLAAEDRRARARAALDRSSEAQVAASRPDPVSHTTLPAPTPPPAAPTPAADGGAP
ncbi:MAG: hypothetical protein R3A52_26890 [Polyangiales bacterium]